MLEGFIFLRSQRIYTNCVLSLFTCLILASNCSASDDSISLQGLEFVDVRALGNVADPMTGTGSVDYPYLMGKFEVTNQNYADFLNAAYDPGNKLELFNPLMEQHFWGGIETVLLKTLDKSPNKRSTRKLYRPKKGYADLPVTFVSWFDAARFINWLHYGRPEGLAGTIGITEGTREIGVYDTVASNFAEITRNTGARFWLPSVDEWRKAAFYDNEDGGDWWSYATELSPINQLDLTKNSATFFTEGRWTVAFPHLTPVGYHSTSPSPWGTFDQGGNVAEWIEKPGQPQGTVLGGSLFMDRTALKSGYIDGERPSGELSTFGFRVASAHTPYKPINLSPHNDNIPGNIEQEKEVSFLGSEFLAIPANRIRYDTDTGRGLVFHDFLISKTETTNEQWVMFLNDIGRESAEHLCLFVPAMENGLVGGIKRTNTSDFKVKTGWETRPITYITWYAAARFTNWIHYRLTVTTSDDGLTEGTDKKGVYDTRNFPEACGENGKPALQPDYRNPGSLAFLPTVNEWYLAAFAERNGAQVSRFWFYPTRSDLPPENRGESAQANYQVGLTLGEGAPYFVADVGAYTNAPSPSGTLQQGGNVWEWAEDWKNKGNRAGWRGDEWTRGVLGGSFNYIDIGLNRRNVDPGAPNQTFPFYGLRIAMSPSAPPAEDVFFPPHQSSGVTALLSYHYASIEGKVANLVRRVAAKTYYRTLAVRIMLVLSFAVFLWGAILGIKHTIRLIRTSVGR